MKKIGIFYGSSTGTCESLAEQLAGELGVTGGDVHSADKLTAEYCRIGKYLRRAGTGNLHLGRRRTAGRLV